MPAGTAPQHSVPPFWSKSTTAELSKRRLASLLGSKSTTIKEKVVRLTRSSITSRYPSAPSRLTHRRRKEKPARPRANLLARRKRARSFRILGQARVLTGEPEPRQAGKNLRFDGPRDRRSTRADARRGRTGHRTERGPGTRVGERSKADAGSYPFNQPLDCGEHARELSLLRNGVSRPARAPGQARDHRSAAGQPDQSPARPQFHLA